MFAKRSHHLGHEVSVPPPRLLLRHSTRHGEAVTTSGAHREHAIFVDDEDYVQKIEEEEDAKLGLEEEYWPEHLRSDYVPTNRRRRKRTDERLDPHAFERWWFMYVEALSFLAYDDLASGEIVCKGVKEMVQYHGLWKLAFLSYRSTEAPHDAPIALQHLNLGSDPHSFEARGLWKSRLLQYLSERLPLLQRSLLVVKERPLQQSEAFWERHINTYRVAGSLILRMPQRWLRDQTESSRGFYRTPFIGQTHGPNSTEIFIAARTDMPASEHHDPLPDESPEELWRRRSAVSAYLCVPRGAHRVVFEMSILKPSFTARNPMRDCLGLSRDTVDFAEGTRTVGWVYGLQRYTEGWSDFRLSVQFWALPPLLRDGDARMSVLNDSMVVELLADPVFSVGLKLQVMMCIGDICRELNFCNRQRLQIYIVEAALDFIDRELKEIHHIAIVCGMLWNVLDTSILAIADEIVARVTTMFCSFSNRCYSKGFACDDKCSGLARRSDSRNRRRPRAESTNEGESGGVAGEGRREAEEEEDDQGAQRQELPQQEDNDDGGGGEPEEDAFGTRLSREEIRRQSQISISHAIGALWNIPVNTKYRRLLGENQQFLTETLPHLVLRSLNQRENIVRMFSGLHLLVCMLHHGYIHPDREALVLEAVEKGISFVEDANVRSPRDIGVSMSPRDVADFFLPVLSSKYLCCVRFGAWCIHYHYCIVEE